MKRFLIPLLLLLTTAACVTPGQTPPATGVGTSVDAKIAAASKKLVEYCTLAQVGLTSLKLFVHDAHVQQTLAVAEPTVTRFCNAPPQIVQDAAAQMAQLVMSITQALQKAAPPPGG